MSVTGGLLGGWMEMERGGHKMHACGGMVGIKHRGQNQRIIVVSNQSREN